MITKPGRCTIGVYNTRNIDFNKFDKVKWNIHNAFQRQYVHKIAKPIWMAGDVVLSIPKIYDISFKCERWWRRFLQQF